MASSPSTARRVVLQAGLAGLAGLALPKVLRAQGPSPTKETAVIYILQEGGASQFETYDPKPEAGSDLRGEFAAIPTSIAGIRFSELMRAQANIAQRFVVLRSIHHPSTQHSSSVHLIKTGYYCQPPATDNEMPSIGSCVAKLRGAIAPNVPPYVLLYHGVRYDGAHYLGARYQPFVVKNSAEKPTLQVPHLQLVTGLTQDQLQERTQLLNAFDQTQRVLNQSPDIIALDDFQKQALDLVTGPTARQAFDLDAEPLRLRERYGRNYLGERLLLARRLIEHGVRFLTVGTFGWDHHGSLWKDMRRDAPAFDQGVATLIQDLHDRGLAERVLVVVMGEFGRTPTISTLPGSTPGRDHWADAMSVLLAGGGFEGGQVIGATDAKGAQPVRSPYRLESVLALMYRHLGIDPAQTFDDPTGRLRALLEHRDRITELEC